MKILHSSDLCCSIILKSSDPISSFACAVTTTTGMPALSLFFWMYLKNFNPDILGITRSREMTSGFFSVIRSSA